MANNLELDFEEGSPKSKAGGAEYQNWELKQSLAELKQIVECVAAFATAKGGAVRVGFSPDGQRTGCRIAKGALEGLANEIKMNTEPPQFPSIAVEGDEDDAVIHLEISESPLKPVAAYNVPRKRVGRTNQALKRDEVQRLMEETTNRTWDAVPFDEFKPADAARGALDDYCVRLRQQTGTDAATLFQNLGLLRGGVPVRGAALVFSKKATFYFPNAQIKCARFLGTDSVDFLDEQTLEGALIEQLFEALAFIKRNTRQGIRITGDPQHERIPEYPDEAIREAVTNALVHRDYASTATIQIRIYDDRMEIWNPGLLPEALTIDALYRKHASHPRNSRLVQLFNRAHLMEHFGSGTLRIVSSCVTAGMPRPEFSQEDGMFAVRFHNATPKTAKNTTIGDNQGRIVRIARQRGRIQTGDVVKELGIGRATAARMLRTMTEAGILHRVGQNSSPKTFYTPYLSEIE